MNICILEDDRAQAAVLEKLLQELSPEGSDVRRFSSARSCLKCLDSFVPDLLFRNPEISWQEEEFFREQPCCPVVLLEKTAERSGRPAGLERFDSLAKPVDRESLKQVLRKYTLLKNHFTSHVDRLAEYIQERKRNGKRFLVKTDAGYQAVDPEDIAYVRADKNTVTLSGRGNRLFQVEDATLAAIFGFLNAKAFYRANRKFIVNANYIRRFKPLPDNRMRIELTVPVDMEIYISRENTVSFKRWIGDC